MNGSGGPMDGLYKDDGPPVGSLHLLGGLRQGMDAMDSSGSGVPLHMEYLTQAHDFGNMNMGIPMTSRLTQIQPMSYLPPWHLTNGDIRFQSNPLSFNGFEGSVIQYPAVPQPQSYFPPYASFTSGFSGNLELPLGHFAQYQPPLPPNLFANRNTKSPDSGLGADSMNWRSPSNGSASDLGSQAPSYTPRERNGGRKRNGPSRNNWRADSVDDTSDANSDAGSRQAIFEEQILKFPRLPLETHKKVQQMYSNRIVEYFDVGLVRFQKQSIVDTQKCHVIFTTKAETGQYWLMAFAKKSRTGTLMKFNRLLTPHLKVTTTGKTAVELAPSKASPHDGEQYVFSFPNEYEATKFLEILNNLRSKLWNHDELRLASARNAAAAADQAIASTSSDTGSMSDATPSAMLIPDNKENTSKKRPKLAKPKRVAGMRVESIWGPTPRSTLFQNFKMDGPGTNTDSPWRMADMMQPKAPSVVFTMPNATLYVKTRNDFTLLGVGTLKIVSGRETYHELEFFGTREELICSHNIYTWNKMRVSQEEDNKWTCAWTAAANLIQAPRNFPTSHEFKLEVDEQAAAIAFQTAFSQSTEIATLLRPSGTSNPSTAPPSTTDETQDNIQL